MPISWRLGNLLARLGERLRGDEVQICRPGGLQPGGDFLDLDPEVLRSGRCRAESTQSEYQQSGGDRDSHQWLLDRL